MIKEIFKKTSVSKPIILTNCTLFMDLVHYEIGTTYLFNTRRNYKVEEFGISNIKKYIKGEVFTKGYFSSLFYLDLFIKEDIMDLGNIAIIGYSGEMRYHVFGISITKMNMKGNKYVCKFNFLELKQI